MLLASQGAVNFVLHRSIVVCCILRLPGTWCRVISCVPIRARRSTKQKRKWHAYTVHNVFVRCTCYLQTSDMSWEIVTHHGYRHCCSLWLFWEHDSSNSANHAPALHRWGMLVMKTGEKQWHGRICLHDSKILIVFFTLNIVWQSIVRATWVLNLSLVGRLANDLQCMYRYMYVISRPPPSLLSLTSGSCCLACCALECLLQLLSLDCHCVIV